MEHPNDEPSPGCVHQMIYDIFEGLYEKYKDQIDERINPAVELLNTIPGLQTTFSCSGHTSEERPDTPDGRVWRGNVYVTFITVRGDTQFITRAFNKYISDLTDIEWRRIRPRLSVYHAILPLNIGRERYNSWKLEFAHHREIEHLELVAKGFEDFARTLVEYAERMDTYACPDEGKVL